MIWDVPVLLWIDYSIFTHDKKFGHTGVQPKVDPNTQKVDTNRKMAWLAANGKPEGWKMFKK